MFFPYRTIVAVEKFVEIADRNLSSSHVYLVAKRRWQREKPSVLFATFFTGYFGHVLINYQKRKELWCRVDKMYHEEIKRTDDLSRRFWESFREERKPSS